MASRKLTALPTATEVTTSDKIYIVDVSDTTESPQGTSKQAVISELPSSGITSLTSTDGSISIDLADPSAPDLSIPSGDYDPTLTNVTGLLGTTVTAGFYSKSGDIVTASFTLSLEFDVASDNGTLNFSLPILPDANFANSRKVTGVFSINSGTASDINNLILSSTTGAKTGSLDCTATAVGVSITVNIVLQYSLV